VPLNAVKSPRVRELSESLYDSLQAAGVEVLLDDRDARPGVKFADAELLGIPHRIVISDRGIDAGRLEYRNRRASANEDWPVAELLDRLRAARGITP
jgi:prolyl-tRNA synthetase